jgi:hypothetical protein
MAFKIKDGVRIGLADVFNNAGETLNLKVKDTNSGAGFINVNTQSLGGTSYIQSLQAKAGTIALTSDLPGKATSTVLGLIELWDNAVQTTAANAVTTTANRTYGIQLNAADQAVVNVPWVAANNGTLGAAANTTGATNTSVALNFSAAYSADTATNVTINPIVGPALVNLASFMTTATAGFIKRSGQDTYVIDTNTYITSQASDFGVAAIGADSGYTWGAAGVNTNQTADTVSDTLTFVAGTAIELFTNTVAGTDAIKIQHADTSTLSGTQGSAGIASLTVDGFGHVTAVTTATYLTSFTEADTLQTVTSRGATSNVATISLTASTVSSSTGTGTLVVTGGVGIGGAVNIGGAVIIGGNLTVNGTTTTVNSTTTTLDDPIITLGGDTAPASDDNKDRGVEFRYFDTAARIGFFGYDDSSGKFAFLTNATNASEVFSGTKGTVDANLEWADILNKPKATSTTLGLVELFSDTVQNEGAQAVTSTASRTYGIQFNAADQMVVNVPWVNTTYGVATSTTLGLVELASDTVQTVAFNTITATAGRTYGIQLNGDQQAVVNVPWTAANNGTLTAAAGTTGATNTNIALNFSTTYSADTATNTTINPIVGPSLVNLAAFMTTATAGFIRRSGQDTYVIDTNTYLTSYTETDTLQTVTTRGNTTTTNVQLNGSAMVLASPTTPRIYRQALAPANITVATAVAIDSWLTATYRSAKYTIQISQGAKHQVSELRMIHDGSLVYLTEFSVLETNSAAPIPVTFTAVIASGTLTVNATITDANTTNASVIIERTLTVV